MPRLAEFVGWQERQDSNPRPLVLETSALAKLSYAPALKLNSSGTTPWFQRMERVLIEQSHLDISMTTAACWAS